MNKKAFTLIELLGVIIILSVVITLVTPRIIEQIKDANESTNTYTNKYVVASAERYLKENINDYPKDDTATYCLPIKTLTDLGYLKTPVLIDKEDITETHVVKITYDNKYMYEIVEDIDCVETTSE